MKEDGEGQDGKVVVRERSRVGALVVTLKATFRTYQIAKPLMGQFMTYVRWGLVSEWFTKLPFHLEHTRTYRRLGLHTA